MLHYILILDWTETIMLHSILIFDCTETIMLLCNVLLISLKVLSTLLPSLVFGFFATFSSLSSFFFYFPHFHMQVVLKKNRFLVSQIIFVFPCTTSLVGRRLVSLKPRMLGHFYVKVPLQKTFKKSLKKQHQFNNLNLFQIQ